MERYNGFEIAVIGLAGRFPKADTIEQYWKNLKAGVDCISRLSDAELRAEGESEERMNDPLYVRSNAYVENKEYFDSDFFGYRPDEAELMDPQIRKFHECCWEALEDSGYGKVGANDRIGLFAAGTPNVNWELYAIYKNQELLVNDFTASHLRNITYLSSSVAYKLNFKGPAIFLQTACSSSLVAVHQACNSLLWGECSMALAGGITLLNHSKKGYTYAEGMILSKDGKCRPFDAHSSGTVGGEGAGVVVLKRLKDALRDRDHIYAVIKGTGINNDGNHKIGFTAPGINGQVEAIRKAHKMAGITPESIGFIEAHGTATELGDPVELEALKGVFGNGLPRSIAIGSVKSNIGHLDAAAGVAGLIKTVLAIKNKQIPATVHFTQPNPKIDFGNSPFYVNAGLREWEQGGDPLRAGVSSFGIGGTNAHIVLESPPVSSRGEGSRDHQLIVLSGRTQAALEGNIARLKEYLAENEGVPVADIAYTLQLGRTRFQHRRAFVCGTREEALQVLQAGGGKGTVSADGREELLQVIFMFPGQGAQYVNMCKDLYEKEKVFKDKVDECLGIARDYSPEDLLSVLYPDGDGSSDIDNTKYAQPLLFIIEYALAHLLSTWGIKPDRMIGHSIGEYVAACLSGVLSLNDAIRLVVRRGELMSRAAAGDMLSVRMREEELRPYLDAGGRIDIAVINGERSVVAAGQASDIDGLVQRLTAGGHMCKRIRTSHAFHSYMMEGILDEFEREVGAVTIHEPAIPYISNLTGEIACYEDIKRPSYWSRHLRSTVQFLRGAETLVKQGPAIFIEIGPGRSLSGYVGDILSGSEGSTISNTVRQHNQEANDQRYLVEKLGHLWLAGVEPDWAGYYRSEQRRRVSLPAYVFDKKPYTALVNARKVIVESLQGGSALTKSHTGTGLHLPCWRQSMAPGAGAGSGGTEQERVFLVIPGMDGFGKYLAGYLTRSGRKVITAGQWISLEALGNAIADITDVVYCVGLERDPDEPGYENLMERLDEGYRDLSFLAKSIVGRTRDGKVNLTVVSNHLVHVTGDDRVDPVKAALLGPAKVIPVEMHTILCKVVDIDYPFASQRDLDDLMPHLVNELTYPCAEPVIAYRRNERWTPSFDVLEENGRLYSGVEIKKGGTYIITGGFGGMGLSVAADLARNHQANLILVHRSEFPERSEWEQWMQTHEESDPVSGKIDQLLKMESAGSRVELYRVELSREEEVGRFSEMVRGRYGAVNGLIWAAGEVDYGGMLLKRKDTDYTRYVSSKVHGLLFFEKHFGFGDLDFIALFSSIGNVFYQAKFGQAGYNAANEFLEKYVYYARKKWGIHAFTIDWCDWLDTGMTVRVRLKEAGSADIASINAQIAHGVSPQEGCRVFYRCLHSKAPVTVVYKGDIEAAIRSHQEKFREAKEWMTRGKRAGDDQFSGNAGEEGLEGVLTGLFVRFFGKTNVRPDDDFFELGGDSLKGMTLVARINQELGATLTIGDIYRHPTIRQLAARLWGPSVKPVARNIPRAPEKEYYVLSSAQKRMLFLQLFDPGSTVYNEFQSFWLKGKLDREKLKNTFVRLVRRHESLRTQLIIADGETGQVILEEAAVAIEEFPYDEKRLDETIASFIRPFDLRKAPLFRIGIIAKGQEEHLVLIDLHHIVTDGISQAVLIKDFAALYKDEPLREPALHYKDYAEWQQSEEQQLELVGQRRFWLDTFSKAAPVLDLPTDFPRPPVKRYDGAMLEFSLDGKEKDVLAALAGLQGVTMYTLLLSIYYILLHKLSGLEDIVVGTPVAGRQHGDLEHMIGMFVNTLPLRAHPGRGKTFREFLMEVHKMTLACFENQMYQYEDMIDELQVSRDTSRNPLFDVLFSFINFAKPELELPGLVLVPHVSGHKTSRFDMTLWAMVTEADIKLTFEYPTGLFRMETIGRFSAYFKEIALAVARDADLPIARIDMLPDAETHLLLHAFNDTQGVYPEEETVVSLFRKQAHRTPGKTAVNYEGQSLTYRELDERSDRLAHHLRTTYRTGVGDRIGFMCSRSVDMLTGLLGIMKSGAAYVPVDPSYPGERIAYILRDSEARLVICDRDVPGDPGYSGDILRLDRIGGAGDNGGNGHDAGYDCKPGDLCYLIYTSGSTGNPKGVMIAHSNVVNFFSGLDQRIETYESDCMLAVTSTSFDISVLELFWTLCRGIEIVIHPSDIPLSGLNRYLPEEHAAVDLSLFFFSSYDNKEEDKYDLLLESVKYADREGFHAVWTPERHFHEFGGLYPNPSVISSALAMITGRIQLRSGSVVSPLHDTVRLAEEWSVVDNLSKGRVGISFASGWNPDDFVLGKDRYGTRQAHMYEQIKELRKLWSGGYTKRENGLGKEVEVRIFPSPLQKELPVWVTSSGSEETFRSAGAVGANILTHLLGQDIEELARKIRLYRETRALNGYDPGAGKVTIMLHTYVGEDINEVERLVEKPFIEYLVSSIGLARVLHEESGFRTEEISAVDRDIFLKNAFKRYYQTASLIGTKGSCSKMLQRLKEMGVDEVACLVDFGLEKEKVLAGLRKLKELKQLFSGHGKGMHKPITMLQSTPSFIRMAWDGDSAMRFLRSLRVLLLGGEAVPGSLVRGLKMETGADIYNMYGPTETTIWSCMHKFGDEEDKVSVGTPMLNTRIYILNEDLQMAPIGMVGNLYIGGAGVSAGYWRRGELTAERFIPDPFFRGGRIYRTGDLARWRSDGRLELMGREDYQVKVRGHRIELGEIESCLLRYEGIREAVVVAREEKADGDRYLAAYVVAEDVLDIPAVRAHLAQSLPDQMIPAYFSQLAQLPLTPNGKIDRKALPDPVIGTGTAYQAPSGQTEEKLVEIWSDILKMDKHLIGVAESFFELGGHSIRAIHLTGRIQKEFSVQIDLKTIFEHSTIVRLAGYIDHSMPSVDMVRIRPVEKKEFYPASSAQERLYYIHQLNSEKLNYNIFTIYRIAGECDSGKILQTFRLLIDRHESLRTRFLFHEGTVVQQICPQVDFALVTPNAGRYGSLAAFIEDFVRPFDLSAAPLLRAGIWKDEKHGYLLLVDIHHIICDGISRNIIMNDFKRIYGGMELAPAGLTYADYARWQKSPRAYLENQRQFWVRQLAGEVRRLDLPVNGNRDLVEIFESSRQELYIKGAEYLKAKRFAADAGVSDFMFLLSVYAILLARIAESTDIIIGTDGIGRTLPCLNDIVGAFVNVLPLRLRVNGDVPYPDFLASVKKCVLEAYDNQDFQYDQIVALLGRRDEKYKLFDVYFSFINFLEGETGSAEEVFTRFDWERQGTMTRHELELDVVEADGSFRLVFNFSTALYEPDTIALFVAYYNNILRSVLDNKAILLDGIELEAPAAELSLQS